MFFGLFKKKKTSFADFCIKLADPLFMGKAADMAWQDAETLKDKRIDALAMIIMGTAGGFVKAFSNRVGGFWQGSDKVLKATNLDVIAVEAIIWTGVIFTRLWFVDKEDDPRAFKLVAPLTIYKATQRSFQMVEDIYGTKLDDVFNARDNLYMAARKQGTRDHEVFSQVVSELLGCKSFDDARAVSASSHRPSLEFNSTFIAMYAAIHAATMPEAGYTGFKNVLDHYENSR